MKIKEAKDVLYNAAESAWKQYVDENMDSIKSLPNTEEFLHSIFVDAFFQGARFFAAYTRENYAFWSRRNSKLYKFKIIMKIDTNILTEWKIATKTRPIKAKPLINLLVDKSVASKFFVDTLEGHEPLGDGVVICVGEAGDAWQQMPKKLLQKYKVIAIDTDGWMVCEPLPDNSVNCYEVTYDPSGNNTDFYIIGQWGATVGNEKNVQKGSTGDFICQNRTDPSDVWIVKRKLFLNTYIIKS